MAKLVVQATFTATNTNQLSGTDLQTMPGPGLLTIWEASTVNTATLTLTVGQENITRAAAINLRTNGVPNLSDDAPIASVGVVGGEQTIANLGGTTGTVYLVAVFTPLDEL